VLCAGLIVVVPAIYLPYALHNLPVAAHVDERTSLLVLKHFHDGSLNPQFFMYPMLYYYVTYFLTAAFPFSKVLLYGRLLNLSFVGLTAAIMYCLCERHLESRAAGVVAVLCIVSSTTITDSAAYICTDVLLAATSIAALFYLVEFFHYKGRREWLVGMLLCMHRRLQVHGVSARYLLLHDRNVPPDSESALGERK
jgi:hypothetical protein